MMVCVPALNLFLYNCLVVYIARKVQRIINVPSTNASWPRIPLIGRVFGLQPGDPPSDGVEFHDVLWNVNLHVNFLLLLPALFQIRNFGMLVALILMWNFYVYQRLLDFYLKLVCHLWWSDLGWAYYVPLVFFGLVMNTLHLTLIVGTMKLQTKGPEDPHAHSESEIQSLSLAQQEMVGSVAMGDVPER
ncbi:uncharacterized protein LOC108030779 isoform X1 [Drosophila biarmipes]|uniref:uncharacterized protein LOC108030779 isoform X1 n=1 Tax=Drosophila biarmipes TaxID=125945 RepID=UPI0007E80921|nr:uncharacterized protein LOC108030779 isoform X1 [Drosophila biarmipes]